MKAKIFEFLYIFSIFWWCILKDIQICIKWVISIAEKIFQGNKIENLDISHFYVMFSQNKGCSKQKLLWTKWKEPNKASSLPHHLHRQHNKVLSTKPWWFWSYFEDFLLQIVNTPTSPTTLPLLRYPPIAPYIFRGRDSSAQHFITSHKTYAFNNKSSCEKIGIWAEH